MPKNQDLNKAAAAKKDEFYTQLSDIEAELRYYRQYFSGKTVLCNCDDPFESDFFKYFVLNFNRLGLKKLIATGYAGSPVAGMQLSLFANQEKNEQSASKPYKAEVEAVRDATGNGAIDMQDIAELIHIGEIPVEQLQGDGDFRSQECLNLLQEADVVVTNPPFSLFREYVATLMEHEKKFIIIGNVNAITYKEIFPLLQENKMWLGASIHSGDRAFYVPDDYPLAASNCGVDENGRKYIRVKGVRWFTNLDYKKRHEELILVPRYDPEKYPKYDNYDAIEVAKVADIPCDYEPGYLVPIEYKQQLLDTEEFVFGSERKNSKGQMCVCVCVATLLHQRLQTMLPAVQMEHCNGLMGVPITFLDKYNPEQFEIVGADYKLAQAITLNGKTKPNPQRMYVNGKRLYSRILIRRKMPNAATE